MSTDVRCKFEFEYLDGFINTTLCGWDVSSLVLWNTDKIKDEILFKPQDMTLDEIYDWLVTVFD